MGFPPDVPLPLGNGKKGLLPLVGIGLHIGVQNVIHCLQQKAAIDKGNLNHCLPGLALPVRVALEVRRIVFCQRRRRVQHKLGHGIGKQIGTLGRKDGEELRQAGERLRLSEWHFAKAIVVRDAFGRRIVELSQVHHVRGAGAVEVRKVPVPARAALVVVVQVPVQSLR